MDSRILSAYLDRYLGMIDPGKERGEKNGKEYVFIMARRWSKLQTRLYNLMDPSLNMQLHMALYEMNSNDGYHGNKLPRYWITIGKEIVFDYPKEFDTSYKYGFNSYPWDTDISAISKIIEEYIQRPRTELMVSFEHDRWNITDVFLACDRRMGKQRLIELKDRIVNPVLIKIINKRLGENSNDE